MGIKEFYELKFESKYISNTPQTWIWYGKMKGELKVLRNLSDYTSDTELLMDKNHQIVKGYSYLVNPDSTITVTKIDDPNTLI